MKIPDLLKIKEVLDLCRFKKTTLYKKIKDDGFPKPKKIGERMARWSKKELLDWIQKKGFDTSEIR
jgi:prophage regulatory protein